MRLTCPNCDAQYEVDDRAIPENGRDVQCSNCGHTWYQLHPDFAEYADAEYAGAEYAGEETAAAPTIAPTVARAEGTTPPEALEIDPDRGETAPATSPDPGTATDKAEITAEARPHAPTGMAAGPDPSIQRTPPRPTEPESADEQAGAISGAHRVAPPDAEAATEEDEAETISRSHIPPALAARRRSLDANVQSVLREEAAREQRVRATETGALESQPDLGLAEPARKTAATSPAAPAMTVAAATPVAAAPSAGDAPRRRPSGPNDDRGARPATGAGTASSTAAEEPPEAEAARRAPVRVHAAPREEARLSDLARHSRRELLPDIEEINSTLRATNERGRNGVPPTSPDTSPAERKRGFRLGFSLGILIIVFMALLYLTAPALAQRFPQMEPFLRGYVGAVASVRLWLDGLMRTAATMAHRTP